MKLYHYIHCPFCVRVRMAMGFLETPYSSVVLPYNDEKTPLSLTDKKMLPIAEYKNSKSQDIVSNESLNIIKDNDVDNKLANELYSSEVEELLGSLGKEVHSLAMPYWIWTPEFDEASREYFQNKKEVKRGPFKELVKNREKFIQSLNIKLNSLDKMMTPYYKSDKLTINDIAIASHLWGMYIVPEFQFSDRMNTYLMNIKSKCNFNYHEDYWK